MKDKKTITVLLALIKKYPLTKEEKEAVLDAVGILSWTMLAEHKVKAMGKKIREKRKEN